MLIVIRLMDGVICHVGACLYNKKTILGLKTVYFLKQNFVI